MGDGCHGTGHDERSGTSQKVPPLTANTYQQLTSDSVRPLLLGRNAVLPRGERFVLHVLILEQLIEREFRVFDTPMPDNASEKQNALKPPSRAKFCHLQKLFTPDNLFVSTNSFRIEKMSTSERYGSEIWRAVLDRDLEALTSGTSYWFTAREIASRGGVSTPTARKYLALLVERGLVARAGTKNMPIYALVKTEF